MVRWRPVASRCMRTSKENETTCLGGKDLSVKRTHDIVGRIDDPRLANEFGKRNLTTAGQGVLGGGHHKEAILAYDLYIDILVHHRPVKLAQHDVHVALPQLAKFLGAGLRGNDVNDYERMKPGQSVDDCRNKASGGSFRAAYADLS
jgi:hypothetical protein